MIRVQLFRNRFDKKWYSDRIVRSIFSERSRQTNSGRTDLSRK